MNTITEILDDNDDESNNGLGGRTVVIELTNLERIFCTTAWKVLRDSDSFNHLVWMSADQEGHLEFYAAQWPTMLEAIDCVVNTKRFLSLDLANHLKKRIREAAGVK